MKFRMLLITLALVAFASLSYGQAWTGVFQTADDNTGEMYILTKNCEEMAWDGEPWASNLLNGIPSGVEVQIMNDNAPYGVVGPEDAPPTDLSFTSWLTGGTGLDGLLMSPGNGQSGGLAVVANNRFYLKLHYEETTPAGLYVTDYVSGIVVDNGSSIHSLAFISWTCTHSFTPGNTCDPLTPSVTLIANTFPFPSQQSGVKACAKVGNGVTEIIVPVINSTNQPHISVQQGCLDCGDDNCVPLGGFILADWTFGPLSPAVTFANGDVATMAYRTNIRRLEGEGCCACIHLDFIEPVEMTSFDAVASDNSVTLNWSVASQTGITSWSVLRNDAKIADVNADVYTYTDTRANNGTTYSYKVVGMSANGASITSSAVEATPMANLAVITKYDVSQNYPNPFNPSTTISFDVLKDNNVSLKVFNAMGQEVTTLANGTYMGGKRYTVTFDAKNLTSGLYFYTVKIGNEFSATKKMLLVK